ncbi:MAG: exodeoxyribonuclease V subunit beta [Thermodesulfobacteriota bacterium]
MTPFDVLTVPLQGTRLIEASAGTGKTFAITGLVLRLIAEEGLDIGRILAVTFTEAATRELRDRIRGLLHLARIWVDEPESGGPAPDPAAAGILDQAIRRHDRRTVGKALRKAVLSFDEAGIFTIHGFCNRVLRQFAFESSLSFSTELVTDQSRFVREVCDDFWRRTFGRASRLICAAAVKRNFSADQLSAFARILIDKPTLRLIPAASPDARGEMEDAFTAAGRRWQEDHGLILDMLNQDQRLSRGRDAYKAESVAAYADALNRLFGGDITPAGLAVLDRFTPRALAASVKTSKKHLGAPAHPFFDCCGRYAAAEQAWAVDCRHEFRGYLEHELIRRKQACNVQYFSDLLISLHRALAADHRGALAAAIREKYRAVLIDEFQDTDPVQYDIFQTLFGSDDHRLFLIGDPKQSIFAFRSADVFSYIRAAARISPDRTYALPRNWRSETSLVRAVNHLFAQADNPFALGSAIGFHEVTADPGNVGNRSPLLIDGRQAGHVELWFVRDEEGGAGALSRERARDLVIDAVAREIASLLNRSAGGQVRLGDRPLGPADIAVLITCNADAGRVRDRLAELNVPSVISKTGGVFSTPEASAVERVLLAMASPSDLRRVNAALADDLIGCSAEDIRAFAEDDARHDEYEAHLGRFAAYHRIWRSGGFIRVFRRFLSDYRVRVRLLGFADGERRLTNVLHLSERIHQADVTARPGMNGLLDWIAERRGAAEEAPEEEQLRLERDDEAVRIVTVWKSKGLQYPVVFCPFMWANGAAVKDGSIVFHDGHDLTLDIGSGDEDHRRAAVRENLSELVRLLYVAVTRAVNRCYLVYGRIGTPGKAGITSLDYILTGGAPVETFSLDDLKTRIQSLDAGSLYQLVTGRLENALDLIHCGFHDPGPSAPYEPSAALPESPLRRRVPAGDRVDLGWRIASFTRLAPHGRAAAYLPDEGDIKRDEFSTKAPAGDRAPARTIFDFPAGAGPGLCVHAIFERLDFSLAAPEEARQVIDAALKLYGLNGPAPGGGDAWGPVVYQMVTDVLRSPVLPHDPGFTLASLSPERKMTEMEFYYPVRRLSPGRLRAALERAVGGGLLPDVAVSGERFEFKPFHGYMRGFIDLVFEQDGKYYLLDWKTNHLGYDRNDYDHAGLCRSVAEESYYLQYYIYTVALHRYLAGRLPDYDYDAHFGGIVYLFVRGVSPDMPGSGVYFDRPGRELVEELNGALG